MPFRLNAVLYGDSVGSSISALAADQIKLISQTGEIDLKAPSIVLEGGGNQTLWLNPAGLYLPSAVFVNGLPLYDTPYGYVAAENDNPDETIAPSGMTDLLYPTITYQDYATPGFDVTTGAYTVPIAGRYLVVAQAWVKSSATPTEIDFFITLNPATTGLRVAGLAMTPSTTNYLSAIVSGIVQCNVGDILQIQAYNTGTTAQYIVGGRGYNSLQINRIL